MRKVNITQCSKCLRIKQYGGWIVLELEDMETIQMNADIVIVVEETCPTCLEGLDPAQDPQLSL